jgi:hypothetical protein
MNTDGHRANRPSTSLGSRPDAPGLESARTACGGRPAPISADPRSSLALFSRIAVAAILLLSATVGALPADLDRPLRDSEYVYIASTRKDGSLGEPAEIWFLYHEGAVWVGTTPRSWRVKRIKWGRPAAKIWVGERDGPSLRATGEIVDDDAVEALLMKTFAEKYPGGWKSHEDNFRKGFADGSRVLVKYTPVGSGE